MPFLFPIVCILLGAFLIVRNISHSRNEDKLREYLKTSPKAKLWVSKFGIEKTTALTKKVFLPISFVISLVLLGVGLWNLIVLLKDI